MKKNNLKFFFEPESIAIIGASKTPGKAGYEILKNLVANEYRGKIYPVNPAEEEIMGLKSFSSVKEIKEKIDLAIFIVPAERTLEPLRECAEKKVPAVIISSGGYAEAGEAGASLQKQILQIAKEADMRIIGPNTSGITSTPAKLTTTFFPLGKIRRGPISYIAQTGNFATHTMKWILTAENFGVARVAGLGNKIDVDDADILEYLGDDPETKAILMYVEGFRDARRFLMVAKKVTKEKPVIVLKGGKTKAGAARAFTHTASLAGDEKIMAGAFRQAGLMQVKRYIDLINVGKYLAFQPIPRGKNLCALAPSGALGVVIADAGETAGLSMVSFSQETEKKLREISASWVKISNPVDMSAVTPLLGRVKAYEVVLEILLQEDKSDIIVPILLASPDLSPEEYSFLPALASRYPQKPILISFTGDKSTYEKLRTYLEKKSLPVFYPLEDIFEVLSIICQFKKEKNSSISNSLPIFFSQPA